MGGKKYKIKSSSVRLGVSPSMSRGGPNYIDQVKNMGMVALGVIIMAMQTGLKKVQDMFNKSGVPLT